MKTITMFKKRENGFLRYRNLLLSLCALVLIFSSAYTAEDIP